MEHYKKIKLIKDFPEKGIFFRHIGPLLEDPFAFKKVIKEMIELLGDLVYEIDVIAGLDARGFIFATALQWELNKPQVMIRKESKTPGEVFKCNYSREYGKSTIIELEKGLIKPGQKVLIVDDLLATAGTLMGAADLIKQAEGIPFVFLTAIELIGLNGKSRIKNEYPNSHVISLFKYQSNSDSIVPIKHQIKLYKDVVYSDIYSIIKEKNDQKVLMYHPKLKDLAKNLISTYNFRESYIDWGRFPDNWPNIQFEPSSTLIEKDVVYLMSVSSIDVFTEQLCLLIALPRQLINSLTIIIPYLGPATHERVSYSGMLATVEPILKILSSCIPSTRSGPPVVRVYDIHALQERFYVTDKIIFKLDSAIPLLKDLLNERRVSKPITIVFPDDGAYKRFQYQFNEHPMIICSKIRDGNERKISIKDKYNWSDSDASLLEEAFIVDDLVQSGGTILNTARALKQLGFTKVNAYVTHAVFPEDSWKKFIDNSDIDKFYTTNSNPEVTNVLKKVNKFVVLDITNQISKSVNATNKNQNQINKNVRSCLKNVKDIYVCSESECKIKSVYKYYNSKGFNIYSLPNCNSQVNEQPIGIEEIKKGCRNRLLKGLEILQENNFLGFLISIESGIIFDENIPYEVTYIMKMNSKDQQITEKMSEKLSLKNYSDIVSKLDGSTTLGSIIEKEYGLKKDTWYTFAGLGKSREDIIVKTIYEDYQDIFSYHILIN